jgi:hypothetical protein
MSTPQHFLQGANCFAIVDPQVLPSDTDSARQLIYSRTPLNPCCFFKTGRKSDVTLLWSLAGMRSQLHQTT